MKPFRVVGLCSAPFTAFNEDGSLDLPSVAAHVDELVRQGVGECRHHGLLRGAGARAGGGRPGVGCQRPRSPAPPP